MNEQSQGQHSGEQTFRCKECGKVLNSAEELRDHSQKQHQMHGQSGQQSHGQQQGHTQQSQGQHGQGQQSGTTHKAGGGS
jgi:uncharacterized C2H2 Zn-finger protein